MAEPPPKCEWCGQEASLVAGHPECRERARRIWDEAYLVALRSGTHLWEMAGLADEAVALLRGRMFR